MKHDDIFNLVSKYIKVNTFVVNDRKFYHGTLYGKSILWGYKNIEKVNVYHDSEPRIDISGYFYEDITQALDYLLTYSQLRIFNNLSIRVFNKSVNLKQELEIQLRNFSKDPVPCIKLTNINNSMINEFLNGNYDKEIFFDYIKENYPETESLINEAQ
jgi:hypothetical protein